MFVEEETHLLASNKTNRISERGEVRVTVKYLNKVPAHALTQLFMKFCGPPRLVFIVPPPPKEPPPPVSAPAVHVLYSFITTSFSLPTHRSQTLRE